MTKKFHLVCLTELSPSNWLSPNGYDWRRPELYLDLARAFERAKFDAVIIGDSLSIPEVYGKTPGPALKSGYQAAIHDPVTTLAMMGAVTNQIGLGLTMSVTFYPPFLLARIAATLDHLSRGRAAVNIVTAVSPGAAQNVGFEDLLPHDERYDRADEFMQLIGKLWDSWEPEAVLMDAERRQFADPAKVHRLDFKGKYYNCRGPSIVAPCPQGRPVIIQAGSSSRGRDFAAKHAEVVIANMRTIEDMREWTDDMRNRIDRAGRDPMSVKLLTSMRPVIGETDEIAAAKRALEQKNAQLEYGLIALSWGLGIDMADYDLDQPLPEDLKSKIVAQQGWWNQHHAGGKRPTLREIAQVEAVLDTWPITGTPEHIADMLEDASVRGGVDGFHLREILEYDYIIEFIDKVVPVLQSRGLTREDYTSSTLRGHFAEF